MTEIIRAHGLGISEAIRLAAGPSHFAPSLRSLEGEVHVWRNHRVGREKDLQACMPYLSMFEQQKATTFLYEKDREDFVLGRGILRRILSQYLGLRPKDIDLRNNKFGKPYVHAASLPVEFNLAQSGNEQVFVFTLNQRIGVDIEYVDFQIDFWALAREHYSNSELDQLMALPENQRIYGFYKGWTQKEAYLKAIGAGYDFTSKDCDVLIDPGMEAQLIRSRRAEDVDKYFLLQLDVAKNYSCTIALERAIVPKRFQSFCIC